MDSQNNSDSEQDDDSELYMEFDSSDNDNNENEDEAAEQQSIASLSTANQITSSLGVSKNSKPLI
jgi:hypothetical protein